MPEKSFIVLLFITLLLSFQSISFAAEEKDVAQAESVTSYISLGDPMVLNLSTEGRKLTFLQLEADVLVKSDEAKEIVEAHKPAIRHQLILLLSEQKAIDMKTPAKREEIRILATQQIRDMIEKMTEKKVIEEVLFSSFLVQ